jgi:O-antigen ligase
MAWLMHVGYALLVVLFLLFFLLSQTRGGFLGLAAAVFVFLLWLTLFEARVRRWGVVGLVCVLLVGGTLYAFRDAPWVQSLPGSRVLTISLSERTAQTRFWTWNSAWQGFLERPLLGWGPENFSTVFDKYFDPRHYVPNEQGETWFDRAHSIVFDYLAETGIIGLATYLGMFGAFYWGAVRHLAVFRRTHPFLLALLVSMPVGYLVQGLLLFEVLPIYLNVFFFLAFGFFLFEGAQKLPRSHVPEAITK